MIKDHLMSIAIKNIVRVGFHRLYGDDKQFNKAIRQTENDCLHAIDRIFIQIEKDDKLIKALTELSKLTKEELEILVKHTIEEQGEVLDALAKI